MDRRNFLRLSSLGLAVPALAPLLTACGDDGTPAPDGSPSPTGPVAIADIEAGAAELQVIEATGELVLRDSRLSFGLLEPDNTPITGADVTAYVGRSPDQPPIAQAAATWLQDEVAARGIYVTDLRFPAAGRYVALLVARTKDGARLRGGTQLEVRASSASPERGERAVSTPTPTRARPVGADPMCSRNPVCAGHALSLDAALRNRKPTVVVFSAPAFCTTELCGPVLNIVQGMIATRADEVNFVHAEAYRKRGKELAPALKAWRFTSEPWTYFIDAAGVVTDRLAGALGHSEVESRIRALGVTV